MLEDLWPLLYMTIGWRLRIQVHSLPDGIWQGLDLSMAQNPEIL